MRDLRKDAQIIMRDAIESSLPDNAVRRALNDFRYPKRRLVLVSIGKAAWRMAHAAYSVLDRVDSGIVITKYNHSEGRIGNLEIYEAGHPVLDENSIRATVRAEEIAGGLTSDDMVLMLISGGGSALFEDPEISLEELQDINTQLLSSGAPIEEINSVRKALSEVKNGGFASMAYPARVKCLILSDVLGDDIYSIASSPAFRDPENNARAVRVIDEYGIRLSKEAERVIRDSDGSYPIDSEYEIIGSVGMLCEAAYNTCSHLGYSSRIVDMDVQSEARDFGEMLGNLALENADCDHDLAFIFGGETVVHLKGKGKGGRNQETALSAARIIAGHDDVLIFSIGSDGTDGPTDAAGGYADGSTAGRCGDVDSFLENNDSYNALKNAGDLIVTGPTGTNVNDLAVVLVRCRK